VVVAASPQFKKGGRGTIEIHGDGQKASDNQHSAIYLLSSVFYRLISQSFFLYPPVHYICDFIIVFVFKEEMGISINSYVWQV
jgi:hypothetical protein